MTMQDFHVNDEADDDEGMWETVIDFTEISKNGVPIAEVIAALNVLNEQD